MLKTRLLTALIIGSFIVAGLFVLSTTGVAIMLGFFSLVAAFEWSALVYPGWRVGLSFVALVALLGLASRTLPAGTVAMIGLLWWAWAAVEVFIFEAQASPIWKKNPIRWLSGAFVLIPAWQGCVDLKAGDPAHPELLLWVLAMVWTADSVAYFVGRAIGYRRIAPLVSPGKSVEGAVAGLFGAALVGGAGAGLLGLSDIEIVKGMVLGGLVGILSVLGDLLESKAKRLADVKDSGHFLPGHGGVLDRIDALMAAVPLFVWGLPWLGVR